tara:strand:+ start:44 stop:571 length:528 start_codon:yes stop_codon:yes gene_type:complete
MSINQVKESFLLLHKQMRKKDFSKTKYFDWWKEQDILTHVRFYLLGYFQKIKSEVQTELIGSPTKVGYFDFVINNVAIEFAIRRPVTHATDIAFNKNYTEILKLMRRKKLHKNLKYGVLVLLDFSGRCLKNEHFEAYRCSTDLLSGNYKKDTFSILYIHIDENNQSECIRKEIRV